jgi:predicted nuclease of predicted toxin-antitoxin system
MIRLLADENFSNYVLEALQARRSDLDVVRVQEVNLVHTPDPEILEWAAKQNRIVLTHDKKTMRDFAYDRVVAGRPMPDVCIVRRSAPRGLVIEDLLILLESLLPEEWPDQVYYVPL